MAENSRALPKKHTQAIVDLFADLGMPRNMAKTLMYISQVDYCRSLDIEKETHLLQPQVSVAIQELRNRGWVEKQDIKKKGKGRPVHHYRLKKELPDIISSFEQHKIKEVQRVTKNFDELKHLLLE